MGIISLKGFHTTTSNNARKITFDNKFKPSTKTNEWLGEGIYFWLTYEDAMYWFEKSNTFINEMCIISVNLTLDENKILDLDIPDNMNILVEFVNTYTNEMLKISKKSPKFKSIEEKRCFYCNLYKRKYSLDAIIFTFSQEYNSVGFTVKRKQVCVHNPETIAIETLKHIRRSDLDAI
jgi:hypothetical protein